jgi:tRNA-Thr(GGU) m(6)t(6)A37 methyltransferase TsaA
MRPIGSVRSPYRDTRDIPKGLGATHDAEGTLEILPEFEPGLADIEGFSHLYVIWEFDRSEGCDLVATPPSDNRPHGVFTTRSPRRPNPIGLTVVELLGRDGPRLRVRGIDMLDGTPILDIKPYLSSVPAERLRRGWLAEAEARAAAGSPERRPAAAFWMSLALAVLAIAASAIGLFWKPLYARETLPWLAQLRGADAVTLFLIVPVLLVSAALAHRGSLAARAVWQGTLLLFLYNYAIFAFAVRFNPLFPVYCGILGLSFYSLHASFLSSAPQVMVDRCPRAPVRATAVTFFLFAFVFAALALGEIVPAIAAGRAPASVTECGLLVNPVHVLDLSFFLPAFVIVGILLLRRRPLAFVLAPALMAFGLLMAATIAGLIVAAARMGLATDYAAALIFLGVAAGCSWLLALFFRAGAAAEK